MDKEKLHFWRTKVVESAVLLNAGLFAVGGLTGRLLGWESWRPFSSAMIWIGIVAMAIGLASALFAPKPEPPGDGQRPRVMPLGDGIMLLMLLSGLLAIALGLFLRRL
jgi:hypothetical protein